MLFQNGNVGTGQLKICKLPGTDVAVNTPFSFQVNGQNQYVVPAGYCVLAGQFPIGTQVTVQEVSQVGYQVTTITVDPAGSLVSSDPTLGTATVTIGTGTTQISFSNQGVPTPTPTDTPTNTPTSTPTPTHTRSTRWSFPPKRLRAPLAPDAW